MSSGHVTGTPCHLTLFVQKFTLKYYTLWGETLETV